MTRDQFASSLAALERAVAGDVGEALRVGIDCVQIAEVTEAVARLGARYLERVFTRQEIESSMNAHDRFHASLAARFAAKEALLKILRPCGSQPEWRSIEVLRRPSGACDLLLHGEAARRACGEGLRALAVSLTHDGPVAAAVVVAFVAGRANGSARGRGDLVGRRSATSNLASVVATGGLQDV